MIPDNVTLIVKAPNQQIEDHSVECLSSWSVGQLKGHLSQVYPSKPRTEEQKIIYSGQLLDDKIILKDILRTYENQVGHTMHLVCTPSKRMAEPIQNPVAESAAESSTDGVRRRNVPAEPNEALPRPEMRQNDQNHTVEMQNYLSSFVNNYGRVPPYPNNYNMGDNYLPVNNDPATMANHMMMMQQAYFQYMQQYANMWQANQQPATAPQPPVAAPPPPETPPAPPAEVPQEEEEGAARDWLDHIYAASRLAVLSSLVYLYGSGTRLLLVLVLMFAAHLHQIGFFRDLNLNNRNNNNQPAGNQPAGNQPAGNQPAGNQPADNQNQPPLVVVNNQPSILAVTWMIFTSFFASLIPDINQ